MEKILVSKCLAGFFCRYDGGSNLVPEIRQLVDAGAAGPVGPEQLGGLPTPRGPSERRCSSVVNREGCDVTAAFEAGAQAALRIALANGCRTAVLKARSPSCGKGCIYNGQFNGELVKGNGIAAELLLRNGIDVMTEEEWLCKNKTRTGKH